MIEPRFSDPQAFMGAAVEGIVLGFALCVCVGIFLIVVNGL